MTPEHRDGDDAGEGPSAAERIADAERRMADADALLEIASAQLSVAARNIANANVAGATRKYANVVTGADGRLEVRSVAQSGNSALFRNVLTGTSDVAKSGVIAGGLDRLNEVIGDTGSMLLGMLLAAGGVAAIGGTVAPSRGDFAAISVPVLTGTMS